MNCAESDDWDYVLAGANLATMAPGLSAYGALLDHAVAIKGEAIAWIGASEDARSRAHRCAVPVREASGSWVTPGLIDCHTHLVYAGNRAREFEQRLQGASYAQIARAGGGIQSTVNATRAASDAELFDASAARARRLMSEGVTTIEVKSGYGLSLAQEIRQLRTARELQSRLPVSVQTTYLGLHALPAEYATRRNEFVALASGPWLETIVSEGLADAVDAFCESIAFTPDEVKAFIARAKALGLGIHLHAGQLSDIGAAALAAEFAALSAGHLEYVDGHGIEAMAGAGTVAVLLPGAYFCLRQTDPPPIARLRSAKVDLAVATDCNPGTSPCTSLLLCMNMACTLFGLTPEESLAGTTRHAAKALGLAAQRGSIEIGKRADLALWQIEHPSELSYGLGVNPCVGAIHRGTWRPNC